MEFLNQPSFWFTLISAIAALYTVINSYVSNHRKPIVYLNWVHEIEQGNQITISFFINNPSVRSISVSDIKLLFGTRECNVTKYANQLASSKHIAYSDSLPINISPYQSETFIVPFQFLPDDIFGKPDVKVEFIIDGQKLNRTFFIGPKRITPDQLALILDKQLQQ